MKTVFGLLAMTMFAPITMGRDAADWKSSYAALRSDFISFSARIDEKLRAGTPKWTEADSKLAGRVITDYNTLDKMLKARTNDERVADRLADLVRMQYVLDASTAARNAAGDILVLSLGMGDADVVAANASAFIAIFRRTDGKIDVG